MNTQLSAEEIPDAVRRLVRDMYQLYGFSQPRDINKGYCDRFARYLVETLDRGHTAWGDTIAPDMSHADAHCVAVIAGRYYDAETPNGVDDVRDIPFFRRCRDIHEEEP
jgi:hypothetical protein